MKFSNWALRSGFWVQSPRTCSRSNVPYQSSSSLSICVLHATLLPCCSILQTVDCGSEGAQTSATVGWWCCFEVWHQSSSSALIDLVSLPPCCTVQMKYSVILPTYNEKRNLPLIISMLNKSFTDKLVVWTPLFAANYKRSFEFNAFLSLQPSVSNTHQQWTRLRNCHRRGQLARWDIASCSGDEEDLRRQ